MIKSPKLKKTRNSIDSIDNFAYQLCLSKNTNLQVLGKLLNKFFVEKKYNKHNYESIILEVFTKEFEEFCKQYNENIDVKEKIDSKKIAESAIKVWNEFQTKKQINEISSLLDLEFKIAYQEEPQNSEKKSDIQVENAHKIYDILNGKNHPVGTIFNGNIIKSTSNSFFQVISTPEDSNFFMVKDNNGKIYSMDNGFTIGKEIPQGMEFYCNIAGNYFLTKTGEGTVITNNYFEVGYILGKKERIIQIFNENSSTMNVHFMIKSNGNTKLIDFNGNIIPSKLSQIICIKKDDQGNSNNIFIHGLDENGKINFEIIENNKSRQKIIKKLPVVEGVSIVDDEDYKCDIFGYGEGKIFIYSTKEGVVFIIGEGEKNPVYIEKEKLSFAGIYKIEKEYYLIYENIHGEKTIFDKKGAKIFTGGWRGIIGTLKIKGKLYGVFSTNEINGGKKIAGITIADIDGKEITIGYLNDLKNINSITYGFSKNGTPKFKCMRYIKSKGFVTGFSSNTRFTPTKVTKSQITKPFVIL
ncbi:MAG: hypothetical protein V3575_03115 [Candidatus Absconditabacteria bacterium]